MFQLSLSYNPDLVLLCLKNHAIGDNSDTTSYNRMIKKSDIREAHPCHPQEVQLARFLRPHYEEAGAARPLLPFCPTAKSNEKFVSSNATTARPPSKSHVTQVKILVKAVTM